MRLFLVLEVRGRVHRHDRHEPFPPVFLPDALAVSSGVPTREMLSLSVGECWWVVVSDQRTEWGCHGGRSWRPLHGAQRRRTR